MATVVCLGELLIDFVPTVTGTDLIDAPAFSKAPGGAAANVAAGLARLGVSSAFMGKVGDDAFGHYLAGVLSDAGIDTRPLCFSREARTTLAFVSLNRDGDRDFMFYRHPGADMLFTPDEVDADAIGRAEVLHFGSISLITEPSRSATLHAVDEARASGCLISYDPNLRLPLWPDAASARDHILQGLALADIVKLSEEELEFLTGTRHFEEARTRLWHERLRLLTITRGPQGCIYMTPVFSGAVAGFAVEAVDTTGAGDAFVAGLLQGLLKAPDTLESEPRVRDLCRFASAVGALTTLERGAIPALPTPSRVHAFLEQNG